MIATKTIALGPVSAASTRRILADTDAHIERLLDSNLHWELAMEFCWDRFMQAGRDLDRLARHNELILRLEPQVSQ